MDTTALTAPDRRLVAPAEALARTGLRAEDLARDPLSGLVELDAVCAPSAEPLVVAPVTILGRITI
jgi:hypothetical protein